MRGLQVARGARADAVRRPAGVLVGLCAALLALGACGGGGSSHASYGALVGDGTKLLRDGNVGAAEQKFQQAVTRDKTKPVAYYDLGVAYQRQGKLAQAKREYFLAIHYDPAYVPALYNQAGLLANTPDRPLAVFYYRRIIRVQPNSPTAFLNLGLIEAATPGERDRAVRDLSQAVKLDPSLRGSVPPSLRTALAPPKKQ